MLAIALLGVWFGALTFQQAGYEQNLPVAVGFMLIVFMAPCMATGILLGNAKKGAAIGAIVTLLLCLGIYLRLLFHH
jgi:hypothetical protein